MFGTLRTIWALMVVVGHIFWVGEFGRFAVFGFYILSGFLMTYVMQKNYGYSLNSKTKFAKNRFLRLFPSYWLACIITILLIALFGNSDNGKYAIMTVPDTVFSIITNLTLIFPHWMPNQIEPRLSPATWALTVELFFYAAIALGVSKTLYRTYVWVALSVLFIVATYALGLFWHARYFSIPAGSLPFSLGALIFFMVKENKTKLIPQVLINYPLYLFGAMLSIAIFVSITITKGLPIWAMEILFYCSLFFSFLLVLSLAMGKPFLPFVSKTIDKKLGDFSYPFYLLHYQAAMISSYLILGKITVFRGNTNLLSVLMTLAILILLSLITIKWVDSPIEKLRTKIKNQKS
ncbi:acyltransferase [Colwellia sp. Bg11-12]|uniref:acyltransferase family protein n=1 Tax=Colwellia sp. Bg11-12 TaxID=2759817 RepID=UPI0015F4ACCB|nr:acyltransferase [Colwellia sp. Bg11-12]MBA6265145.1 acyltransferase [Colwellia sp. Bg11-12]